MLFGSSTNVPIDWVGVVFGLLSAICHATGYLLTKKIPNVHYTAMNFYEFFLHAVGSVIMLSILSEWSYSKDYHPYITTCIATVSLFTTTALQIVALSYGSAAIVAITINMNVPALFFLQAVIQRIIPSYLTIIGSIMILGGVFLVSFRIKINKELHKWLPSLFRGEDECYELVS